MYPKLRLKYRPNLISLAGGMQALPEVTRPEARATPTSVRLPPPVQQERHGCWRQLLSVHLCVCACFRVRRMWMCALRVLPRLPLHTVRAVLTPAAALCLPLVSIPLPRPPAPAPAHAFTTSTPSSQPAEWKRMLSEAQRLPQQQGDGGGGAVDARQLAPLVLDVRNSYEWDAGHFVGAERPLEVSHTTPTLAMQCCLV